MKLFLFTIIVLEITGNGAQFNEQFNFKGAFSLIFLDSYFRTYYFRIANILLAKCKGEQLC